MNSYRWRPHPWHGLEAGDDAPRVVNAYIEITPFDSMKYEIDEVTGYLRIDRPQSGSSLPPCAYGFVPQTYCGDRVASFEDDAREGDGDPLDICVISELPINRAEILISAKVLGGFCMIDDGKADDKIIAVLDNDAIWGKAGNLKGLHAELVARIQHYFSTYKTPYNAPEPGIVKDLYRPRQAHRIIRAAMEDYAGQYPAGSDEEPFDGP
ncbi:MAG: inorganic pyrophosphatase [Opitutales bacterium]|nr:inorganic pyrophosphatase [Opitutales bacterium]